MYLSYWSAVCTIKFTRVVFFVAIGKKKKIQRVINVQIIIKKKKTFNKLSYWSVVYIPQYLSKKYTFCGKREKKLVREEFPKSVCISKTHKNIAVTFAM